MKSIQTSIFFNISHPISRNQPIQQHNKYNSKMIPYDFFCMNEIKISEKIKQLPHYLDSFYILDYYEAIKISEIEKRIENISYDENNKYVVVYYPNKEERMNFDDFLYDLCNIPKRFFLHLIQSFSFLLHSLLKLNHESICFFSLSPENILFHDKKGSYPLLGPFDNAFFTNLQPNLQPIITIIQNIKDYTYQPLEVHVLFYIIHNDLNSYTFDFFSQICNKYMENINKLMIFTQDEKDNYQKECWNNLKKYINTDKTVIINDILTYASTWDHFSLNLVYLHKIRTIGQVFSLQHTFFNDFLKILMKNIHPNPLKRESLNHTIDEYDKLFDKFPDWSFISQIKGDKMKILKEKLFE
jgi:hypothetical protein